MSYELTREYIAVLQRLSDHLDDLGALQHEFEENDAHSFDLEPWTRCVVCRQRGPGITATADGRPVHRWPCRDRLL